MDIRPLTTLTQLLPLEALQKAAWGMSDLEVLPAHHFHALVHNGNSVLGAFMNGRLVGFVFSVLGWDAAAHTFKLYSVLMGVHPDYRDRSVGYHLKLAQRQFGLSIGVPLITWTFDPLQSRNARLNIAKLGAVCSTYHRHFHGELDGINAGIPSDRFEVVWRLQSPHVTRTLAMPNRRPTLARALQDGAVLLNGASRDENGRLLPTDPPKIPPASSLLVEIPADHSAIKQTDPELALKWRLHTRQLFEQLFEQGYVVTDFIYDQTAVYPRSFYLLSTSDKVTT
ncbi:MAG: GNAT family N-acetyltransferase [Candidatus Promineifilaceae bacterium]